MRKQKRLLCKQRNRTFVGRYRGARCSVYEDPVAQFDATPVGPEQAGDHAEQRGLSGSVRSQNRDRAALVHFEIDHEVTLVDTRLHLQPAH